ncbi:hypothetical protein MOQ72_01360 [Saccharopolyspora sp. K220]|uniref:hypothetical protein n=1 Tax=Saccharopolyspora soli TaxID=2926618 RepID=UPI001F577402|nr:hypothetical protein [Saccharopolyspora soli]MCI2416058.1 hypothetical protein [Saccharopolyspora soli]
MTDLAEQLAAGGPTELAGLDAESVLADVSEVAAGPLAPVLAQALIEAASRDVTGWRAALANFIDGLTAQQSLLALASSVDKLLSSPVAVEAHAARLHDVLLRDLVTMIESNPSVAAGRLEGAVRLAVADAVPPFTVLGQLTTLPQHTTEEFVESLPRLVGAAMDRWASEPTIIAPLRSTLDRLRHAAAATVDAAFELACDHLRSALTATTMPAVMDSLTSARSRFATVDAAEEARHDAKAHAAACDAILAFAAQDQARLGDAADRLTTALDQRSAWLSGLHQPSWLRPRRAAEFAWRRLVLLLQAASIRISETIWMDVWEALGAVLEVYTQARTSQPLPGVRATPGLAVVVEPTIENAILRQQSLLAALRRSVTESSKMDTPPLDASTAELLLTRIEAAAGNHQTSRERAPEDGDPHQPDTGRLHRLAPALVRALGERQAANLTAGISDDDLNILDGVVHSGDLARSSTAHPVLDPLLESLLGQLGESPQFTSQVRATFGLLLEQTLRFLFSRADLTTKTWGLHRRKDYDYRRLLGKGERRPLEEDLQQDYYQWLATGQLGGLVTVEATDIAMGRADVITTFGSIRYATEIKRELTDASRTRLAAKYLHQAAEYSNTNVPFGQLLVLDLTPHPQGTPRIDESVWLTRHRPPGATNDRAVIVGVVRGNRPTPHDLSKRAR